MSQYELSRANASLNAQFNIPRMVMSMPGKQNRSCGDGRITIVPGTTAPIEFQIGTADGYPIGMVGFRASFIVWTADRSPKVAPEISLYDQPGSLVLIKRLEIADPHRPTGIILLENEDTLKIARASNDGLRWGLVIANDQGQRFLCQVTRTGACHGSIVIDTSAAIPNLEGIGI